VAHSFETGACSIALGIGGAVLADARLRAGDRATAAHLRATAARVRASRHAQAQAATARAEADRDRDIEIRRQKLVVAARRAGVA